LSRADGSDERPWLREKVYQPKQQRTVNLVKESVKALRKEKKRISLSTIEAKSKDLDPNRKGVHRNTILSNEEARSYYEKYCSQKRRKHRRPVKVEDRPDRRVRIKVDRDLNRARQRYLKLSKEELVSRLLEVEQDYAESEERWLQTNEELMTLQLRAEQAEALLEKRPAADAVATNNRKEASQPTSEDVEDPVHIDTPAQAPAENPDLNDFDYFNEIEDLFIRRRGKHLLLSPVDWALMESWKEKKIPLRIVLRGIDQVFDRHDARRQQRSVKSLLYCQEEVEAQFSEWLQGQVGAHPGAPVTEDKKERASIQEPDLPFTRAAILDHLEECRASLLKFCEKQVNGRDHDFSATLMQTAAQLQMMGKDFVQDIHPDTEKLESSLANLEAQLDQALRNHLTPDQLALQHKEAEEQLRIYRGRMESATYGRTLDNLLSKCLREQYGLPRLSLYYL
jgi:hypothetical protein